MDWSQIAVIVLAGERIVGKALDFLKWREARKARKAETVTLSQAAEAGPFKTRPVARKKK